MGKKFATDKPTMEEIRRLKTKTVLTVDVLLDNELGTRITQLRKDYMRQSRADKKLNETNKAPAILKQIEALEEEAREVTVTFSFRDLGRKRFEDLWKACPPTEDQKEKGYEWDPDEFSPLIIAESSVEPKLTLEEAKELYDTWSTAEAEMLAMTAINANMGVNSIPLSGTGTGDPASSGLSLITAPIEESPTGSS